MLGESVARGYFFDPEFTFCSGLQHFLAHSLGNDEVDVVDLARADLTLIQLIGLVSELPAVDADAVVVFAGNNWLNTHFGVAESSLLASALRSDGYAGAREVLLREVILPLVGVLMRSLRIASTRLEIPVVLMVPEFNLGHWRDEWPLNQAAISDSDKRTWGRLRRMAQASLDEGDPDAALLSAIRMEALDRGTSPISSNMVAAAYEAQGDFKASRLALERARDAVCGRFIPHSPRCPRVLQDEMRASGNSNGVHVVDLPEEFAKYEADVAGSGLFLDYCHLTVKGLWTAARAAGSSVLRAWGMEPAEGAEPPNVSASCRGTAHFLAAIHNAHYGQADEVVEHHLRRAVDIFPEAADSLLVYLRFRTLEGPHWASRAYSALSRNRTISRYLHVHDARRVGELCEDTLMRAAQRVLADNTAAQQDLELLGRSSDVGAATDLLRPRHSARTFRERQGYSLASNFPYFRAHEPISRFFFFSIEQRTLHIRLVARIPSAVSDSVVRLDAGGNAIAIELSPTWKQVDVEMVTTAGSNELHVVWPNIDVGFQDLQTAAGKLDCAQLPDPLPVYGEIARLCATTACRLTSEANS